MRIVAYLNAVVQESSINIYICGSSKYGGSFIDNLNGSGKSGSCNESSSDNGSGKISILMILAAKNLKTNKRYSVKGAALLPCKLDI